MLRARITVVVWGASCALGVVACNDQTLRAACTPDAAYEIGVDAGRDAASCPTLSLTAGCACCLQTSCESEAEAAMGVGWQSLDFRGGACADLIACYCGCGTTRTCVDDCEATHVTAACHDALAAMNDCQKTCSSGGCGSAVVPDASVVGGRDG